MEKKEVAIVAAAKNEITRQLADPETLGSLLATTFKGLNQNVVKRAILEGMIRGFTFKDFLEKNIYAVPFGEGYALVTSIDHARKLGMRSGVIGKSAPTFEMDGSTIVSCSITVKREVHGKVGEWTATVYFDEYNTKRNLWVTKPRTMIAKVAEMHALRMACPEVLSQSYTEEELQKEDTGAELDRSEIKDDAPITVSSDESLFPEPEKTPKKKAAAKSKE